jgi:hypothetical protein
MPPEQASDYQEFEKIPYANRTAVEDVIKKMLECGKQTLIIILQLF